MKTKLLFVEDHELTRKCVSYGLKNTGLYEIVGEFDDGKKAVDFVKNHDVDVILMDVIMPIMNGIEATKIIKLMNPDIKVIMLTSVDEKDTVLKAFGCGANAYTMKNISIEKLVDIISMVLKGELWLSPNLANYILDVLQSRIAQSSKNADCFNLTNREKEILTLIAKGMCNKDIAEHYVLSVYTVKNHVKSIIQKLAVEDRTQAAIMALTEKLI